METKILYVYYNTCEPFSQYWALNPVDKLEIGEKYLGAILAEEVVSTLDNLEELIENQVADNELPLIGEVGYAQNDRLYKVIGHI